VLLAGLTATLYRARAQNYLTYQTTYSLRGRPGTPNLIGYVGNPLLIRIAASGSPTFRELIVRTRKAVLGARDNGDVAVAETAPHGLRRINFNYVPGLESSFDKEDFAPGLSITQQRTPIDPARLKIPWDLHLWLHDSSAQTMLRLVYLKELFEAATAQRLLNEYVAMLTRMCERPDDAL
jgi:non-ribosomal peptide synthetase component F